MFNFINFLEQNRIDYIEHGSGVKKGNININCPFCNLPSTHHSSHHLGINPVTNHWGCWRDETHRGRKPHKLIMKLLNCSYKEARKIIGDSDKVIDQSIFDKIVKGDYFKEEEIRQDTFWLTYPKEFRKFDKKYVRTETEFLNYINRQRGFGIDALKVCDKYKLMYSIKDDFKNRVIIPYFKHGQLVSWSGRSIYKNSTLRYRHLEETKSVLAPKKFIGNYDIALNGGKTLFIVEGVFDYMKVDFYAVKGYHAISIQNMTTTIDQQYYLVNLAKRYEKVLILLDNGEDIASRNLLNNLGYIKNVSIANTNGIHANDPGAMTSKEVKKLCQMN